MRRWDRLECGIEIECLTVASWTETLGAACWRKAACPQRHALRATGRLPLAGHAWAPRQVELGLCPVPALAWARCLGCPAL